MNLGNKLTHRITIIPIIGYNENGEPSMSSTPVSSIACFIDGTHRRVLRPSGREVVANFSIYFYPTQTVNIDDQVSNGVTALGETVLVAGRVVSIERSFHPQYGSVVIEALVEGN